MINNLNMLNRIPICEQRQDSVSEQLRDLQHIANRLGMRDAADAIGQMFELNKVANIKFGCHCDLEDHMEPDNCVILEGRISDCVYAKEGMRPEQCEYWRPVSKHTDKP